MGFFDLLFGSSGSSSYSNVSMDTERKISYEWNKITELISLGTPSQLRQALISADKCLDSALKDVVSGETMGERLKNARSKFDDYTYNRIWEAHKIRNNLIHEAGYDPQHYIIKEAVDKLKSGLIKLGVRL